MAKFEINTPIETEEAAIIVEAREQPLPPGRYRFQLVVVDNDNLSSEPDTVDVIVRDDRRPTAVLETPRAVLFAQDFELSGRRSSDPEPGKIVKYIWTLVG